MFEETSSEDDNSYKNLSKEALREMMSSCRRLCGECLDALSLLELQSLESMLRHGKHRVLYKLKKKMIEQEEEEKRLVKDLDTYTGKQLIRRKRNEGCRIQLDASNSRKLNRGRERSGAVKQYSSEGRQDWDDHLELMRSIRSMKWDIQKLQVLNGRMCGYEIEIDGLDYFELKVLINEILEGRCNVWPLTRRKQHQAKAWLGEIESEPTLQEEDDDALVCIIFTHGTQSALAVLFSIQIVFPMLAEA
ncbi:unnamed protein product [Thlaspi arvense]|uniref:Uncharacterized protein n=1 Tax=Thlaspi arvense TaxID=13288 RepID=A0AAU9SG91_THLAR|nr:unnamed protein product [Thlaspi arvense]